MPGVVEGDHVRVPDQSEASKLYAKGGFGIPQSGGALELDFLEAVYLAEHNRLDVEMDGFTRTVGDLMVHAAREEPGFELLYAVYRDLRNRTFIVKRGGRADFLVLPRGGFPGKTAAKYVVRVMSERGDFDPAATLDDIAAVTEQNRQLLLALVDEEGDVTYYRAREPDPRGDVGGTLEELADLPPASLLEDRVMVFDPKTVEAIHATEHYGRDVGPGLQVGLAETLHLMEEAGLRVVPAGRDRDTLTPGDLRERARALQPDFDLRYRLFCELKARGLVVRTGFKFGTHFRAYKASPDESHAPYLVHAVPGGGTIPWPEASGFIRLSHGVRKAMIFWEAARGFLQLERTRPT